MGSLCRKMQLLMRPKAQMHSDRSVSRPDLVMFASFFCFSQLLALLVFRRGLVASPCALDCKSDFNFIQFQPYEVDELRHSVACNLYGERYHVFGDFWYQFDMRRVCQSEFKVP